MRFFSLAQALIILLAVASVHDAAAKSMMKKDKSSTPGLASQIGKITKPTESLSKDKPVMMEADHFDYDREHAIVNAAGNVEVVQGDFLLLADAITFDQTKDQVTARGHVSVMEPFCVANTPDANRVDIVSVAGPVPEVGATTSHGELETAVQVTMSPPVWARRTVCAGVCACLPMPRHQHERRS